MIASRQLTVIWFSGNLSLPPPSPTMSQCVESVHCFFPNGPAPTAHYYNSSLLHFANLPLQWKCSQSFQKFSLFHNRFGLIYAERDQRNADRGRRRCPRHQQQTSAGLRFHMKTTAERLQVLIRLFPNATVHSGQATWR